MAAFSAFSRKAVDEAYAAAISAGAEDEGAPGLRPNFGPNYYGAYVRDLDGNRSKIPFQTRKGQADCNFGAPVSGGKKWRRNAWKD
jgi:predicted lactoylglutathione lyase